MRRAVFVDGREWQPALDGLSKWVRLKPEGTNTSSFAIKKEK